MSDQPPRNIYNEQPNQGAHGMFNASATSHYGDPRQQRQIDRTEWQYRNAIASGLDQ
jgi:hypothetical protein